MARVLGVIRLSNETDETTSPRRQRAGITQWASAMGHEIVGWAEDLDVSGDMAPWDRPELGPWLAESPPAEFDVIAGTKIDRLSRRLLHFVQLIEWAGTRGKAVVAYMDSVDTSTPTGELVAKVLAIFAEFERQQIKARTADSRRLAREEGRFHGGSIAYGAMQAPHPSGKGWVLVEDPEAAPIMREIVKRATSGEGIPSIVRDLEERRIPSSRDHAAIRNGKEPKGREWNDETIHRMLRSRALRGELWLTGEDGVKRVQRGDDGMPISWGPELITEPEWRALQATLDAASRPKRLAAVDALLSNGIAYCGEPTCNEAILHHQVNVKHERKNAKQYRYYRCSAKTKRHSGCQSRAIIAEELETTVVEMFLGAVGDLEIWEKRLIPGADHRADLERAEQALGELEDDRAAGLYSTERGVARFRAQHAAISANIERLAAMPVEPDRWETIKTGKTFREVWEGLETVVERHDFLDKVGVRVNLRAEALPDSTGPEFPLVLSDRSRSRWVTLARGGSRFTVELPPDIAERLRHQGTRIAEA